MQNQNEHSFNEHPLSFLVLLFIASMFSVFFAVTAMLPMMNSVCEANKRLGITQPPPENWVQKTLQVRCEDREGFFDLRKQK